MLEQFQQGMHGGFHPQSHENKDLQQAVDSFAELPEQKADAMDVKETRYRVTGMDCAACAAKIETAVSRLPGVANVSVSATAGMMRVAHAEAAVLFPAMKKQLGKLGYGVFPAVGNKAGDPARDHDHAGHDHDQGHDHDHEHDHARAGTHAHDQEGGEGQGVWWWFCLGLFFF